MSNHGGKREGAGRPPALDAERMKTVSVRLPQWMIDAVDDLDGDRSLMIRQSLVQAFKLKPPAELREKFAAEWEEKTGKKLPR